MGGRCRLRWLLAALWLACVAPGALCRGQDPRREAASQLFADLDVDGDGKIDEREAKRWISSEIGGSDFGTPNKLDAAVSMGAMRVNADGSDSISEGELRGHLAKMLEGSSMAEWVRHSLQLPQYVQAFQENAITAEDFPLLVMDGGATLENDLKVKSELHRRQIQRNLNRLMLGIGRPPAQPQALQCTVDTSCGKVFVEWLPPEDRGEPPVHKYVVERTTARRSEGPSTAHWTFADELKDAGSARKHAVDFPSLMGNHQYRVAAWNAYGSSEHAIVSNCTIVSLEGEYCPEPLDTSMSDRSMDLAQVKVSGMATGSQGGQMMIGVSTILLVAISFAVRFIHVQHITFMQCLAYCKIWKLGRLLGSTGIQRWACRNKMAVKKASADSEVSHFRQTRDVASGPSAFYNRPGLPPAFRNSMPVVSSSRAYSSGKLRAQSDKFEEYVTDAYSLDSAEYSHGLWDEKNAAFNGFSGDDYTMGSWDRDAQPAADVAGDVKEHHPGLIRGQCAYEGCPRKWGGVRNLKNRLHRHYCGICNLTYCGEHTQISPHGNLGHCGMQSQCVCINCFKTLSKEQQESMEKINKLRKVSSRGDRLYKLGSREDVASMGRSGGSSSASGCGRTSPPKKTEKSASGVWRGFRVGTMLRNWSRSRSGGGEEDWEEPEDPEEELRALRAQRNWGKAIRRVRCVNSFRQAGRDFALQRSKAGAVNAGPS
ncbi:unnamed protein product [Ostreobium quekettii]|uniref:Calmodulin n=1 Tax=Ostreobium quekettii TaxID=121088 RepID=A0A8S1J4N6_9CHLO|nr:unnamed protein product [Ostreobium quekettii]|eukprot:evm.model.scf_1519.5 EVM.evm.TU.scf_1519.5   scf_1519:18675-23088(+)